MASAAADLISSLFDVSVTMPKTLTYAMAHNRRPCVETIAVTSRQPASADITVHVGSRWGVSDVAPIRARTYTLGKLRTGDTVVLNTQDLTLDHSAVGLLEEAAPATLIVTVNADGEPVHEFLHEFQVHARNQWSHFEPAITAAFVQPNHPSVVDILNDASRILGTSTGSTSLQGYQSGPERALHIGRAIYEALSGRIHTYIDPPASFDDLGQKVRPLDEVLSSGQGTCLDLACAYASCLEQAGLRPVMYLVHGHAFTGFLLEDRDLSNPVITDPNVALNATERGDLVMVENTTIPAKIPFADAVEAVREHLSGFRVRCPRCIAAGPESRTHIYAVLDIVGLRRAGILPIPARVERDGVIEIVIDNGPTEPPVRERRDAKTFKLLPNTTPARVQQWKNQLLDLSMRNALLNFRPYNNGLAVLPPEGQLGAIEDHLVDGGQIPLLSIDDPGFAVAGFARDFHAAMSSSDRSLVTDRWKRSHELLAYSAKMEPMARAKDLRNKARRTEQDTSVNTLYLTLGSVTHPGNAAKGVDLVNQEGGDAPITALQYTAPLFLVPIRLTLRRGGQAVIEMDPDGLTTVNYCLVEYLRVREQLELKWFRSDMRDDTGLDIDEGLKRMREEIDEAGRAGRLIVNNDVGIGILQFSKVRLWKDLDEHWEQFAGNPVVHHLIHSAGLRFSDPANPDDQGAPTFTDTTIWNPSPADSAQMRAIVRALEGHSFILEGPPGTGKSQTITNLLAASLTAKKKVLFVAEKAPALSVVLERLQAVGLDPFCLNLHDKGTKPEEIKRQLREAMELAPSAPMDRWETTEREFTAVADALERYRARLHEPTASGWSYFDAYLELLLLGEGKVADVGRELATIQPAQLQQVRDLLANLNQYMAAQPRKHHPWRLIGTTDFSGIDLIALKSSVQRAQTVLPSVSALGDRLESTFAHIRSVEEFSTAAAILQLSAEGRYNAAFDVNLVSADRWLSDAEKYVQQLRSGSKEVTRTLGEEADQLLLHDLTPTLEALRAAAGSFFIGRKRKVQLALGTLLGFRGLAAASPIDAIRMLESLRDSGLQYRKSLEALSLLNGVSALLERREVLPADIDGLVAQIHTLHRFARAVAESAPWAMALRQQLQDGAAREADASAARAILDALTIVAKELSATETSLLHWCDDSSFIQMMQSSVEAWASSAQRNFIEVQRYCDLLAHLAPLNELGYDRFREQLLTGQINDDEALGAFQRAHYHAILDTVGDEQQFDVFDQFAHDRRISKFTDLLKQRQELLLQVIPKTLHEHRTFNARAGGGSVSALRAELIAKRRGARSIRDLLQKYPELISELTPCFLMSPDSVAKFLVPGKIKFDIVVFDEASQIQVADAIGAMGRGTSVIVVGDSKQMPPSRAFAAGSTPTEEELDDTEHDVPLESILDEVVEARIDREMLEWHYRSKDESLIAFSNAAFYEHRLSSFPAPVERRPGLGIKYYRVDGQFSHGARGGGTNPIEAKAMAAEVQRRAHDPVLSKYSMGIVTLSVKQMDAVKQALEDLHDPVVTALLESDDPEQELLVLNLESVQGRERDVIMLGTSYSKLELPEPKRTESKLPLNFGPVMMRGGERRLNVAVTRARREMLVFTSFDPEDMNHAKSPPLKALQQYLFEARQMGQGSDVSTTMPQRMREPDPYLRELAAALEQRGLRVRQQYGLSNFKIDLAITTADRSDEWLVGVLLDNKPWNERNLVLDRDSLPVTVLQSAMGWPAIVRVWLPAWRHSRTEVLDQIESAVHSVATHGAMPTIESPTEAVDDVSEAVAVTTETFAAAPVNTAAQVSRVEPYQVAEFGYVGSASDLDWNQQAIRAVLHEIIRVEAPLHAEDLLKKVARAFGLARVADSRISSLSVYLPRPLLLETSLGWYVYAESQMDNGNVSASYTSYRQSAPSDRPLHRIPPHEAANLMVDLARAAHSISRTELTKEVLTFFGYARMGAELVTQAQERIDWAVQNGYLSESDGLIRPIR